MFVQVTFVDVLVIIELFGQQVKIDMFNVYQAIFWDIAGDKIKINIAFNNSTFPRGADRIRTGVLGFADQCLAPRPPRQIKYEIQ
jgi:hypothetical protein